MKRPLAALAIAYGAGIVVGRYTPLAPAALYAAAGSAALAGALCLAYRRPAIGTSAALLLFVTLGAIAYAPYRQPRPALLRECLDTRVTAEGTVTAAELSHDGAVRLTVRYDTLETREHCFRTRGNLQLTIREPSRRYRYGLRIRVTCRLRRPRNFYNPGRFDYERFLAHRHIYFTALLENDRTVIITATDTGNPLLERIAAFRNRLRLTISGSLDMPQRAMVQALLLGDKRSIPPCISEQFSRLGVAHLLAISGLHIGIVACIAFAAAGLLLRISRRVMLYLDIWKIASLCSVVPVLLYCCVAGLQIPTLRAGIMIVAYFCTLLVNRRHDLLNALALACLILLVWMPASLFEISFQLSFSAVFFLIVLTTPLLARLPEIPADNRTGHASRMTWLCRFFAGTALAAFVASLGTAPLTAYYFHRLSPAGLAANCLLIPVIGFGVVPCSLLAAALLPLCEPLSIMLLKASGAITGQVLLWTQYWSAVPGADLPVAPPRPLAMALYYLLLLSLPFFLQRKRMLHFCALCALVLLAGSLLTGAPPRGRLRVTFLDVGHGDAAVVQFPQGASMLIDSGGLRSENFDIGESVVAPALYALGIQKLTHAVLSHPHRDHTGGMPYLLQRFKPAELWAPQLEHPDQVFRAIISTARGIGTRRRHTVHGTPPVDIDGVHIEFLSPLATQVAGAETYQDTNDCSLVMRLSYGAHSFLFTGDIGSAQESALLTEKAPLSATVLKVPHHGTAASGSPAFLDAVRPAIAVISCRPYSGHDLSGCVLERYRARKIQLLRTDLHGAVQITTDGAHLTIDTCLQPEL